MDLKLDEAGMTFLVGAFVILTVEGIALLIFGRHLIKFLTVASDSRLIQKALRT